MNELKNRLLERAKPIYFALDMIPSVESGLITKSVRIVRCTDILDDNGHLNTEKMKKHHWDKANRIMPESLGPTFFASYQPGEILYVKEPWALNKESPFENYAYQLNEKDITNFKWNSCVTMTKDAARIGIEVISVEMKRLQEITEEELNQAGFHENIDESGDAFVDAGGIDFSAFDNFIAHWNLGLKESDREIFGWRANPWVWVYKFKKVLF